MSPVIDCAMLPALPDGFIDAVDALGRLEEEATEVLQPRAVSQAKSLVGALAAQAASLARDYGQAAYGDALEREFSPPGARPG